MSETLKTKISALKKLHEKCAESKKVFEMDAQVLDEAMKDLMINELGFSADTSQIPFPEILERVINA